jgi:hypothetical protein
MFEEEYELLLGVLDLLEQNRESYRLEYINKNHDLVRIHICEDKNFVVDIHNRRTMLINGECVNLDYEYYPKECNRLESLYSFFIDKLDLNSSRGEFKVANIRNSFSHSLGLLKIIKGEGS